MYKHLLANIAEVASAGGSLVIEALPRQLQKGDFVFMAGRWRKVEGGDSFHLKKNYRLLLTASGDFSEMITLEFIVPAFEKLLKRV